MQSNTSKRLIPGALWVVAMLLPGCFPFEPGSDLDEDAPEPALGSLEFGGAMDLGMLPDANVEETTDVTGTFDVIGTLSPPGSDPVNLTYLFTVTQEGAILDGSATVQIEVEDPMDPSAQGPTFAEPEAVSMDGEFSGTIEGLVVTKDFTELLVEDAMAKIDLEGKVLSSDCFSGPMKLTLLQARLTFNPDAPMDIPIDGEYRASRQGTPGCGGAMQDADMGATMDMGMDMGGGE